MFKPLLSVIIANYNNAHFLKKCLDSILNQTFKKLEIIICDDHSTDNSLDILKNFQKKNPQIIKIIESPINSGVSISRHKAIMQARGTFLTTLDSDDFYLDEKKLEKEIELIQRFEINHKSIIAFSNIIMVDKYGEKIGPQWPPEKINEGNLLYGILSRTCMIPRDFLMKKSVYWEVGGYSPSLKTHEDWDLKIRMARNHEYYYTGIDGCAYRIHDSGLSSISYWKRTSNLYRVFHKNLILIPISQKKAIEREFDKFMRSRRAKSLFKIFPIIKDKTINLWWKMCNRIKPSPQVHPKTDQILHDKDTV